MNLIFPNNSDLTQLLIGGKAYNLAKLTQKGFPVPEWFVLTTEVFDQLIHSIDEDIKLTLKNFKIQEAPIVSDEIKHLIMGLKFPNNLEKQIYEEFDKLVKNDGTVAVRSSATGEDGKNISFAGIFETHLNISKQELTKAIKQCWVSTFSERSILYQKKQGIDYSKTKMAVIIQKMIAANQSGITFTEDPNENNNDILIVAGWGLGEGVVTNSVETDHYWVNRDTKSINENIEIKKSKIVVKNGGTEKVRVTKDKQKERVVSYQEIDTIKKTCLQIEKLFNYPQDVEWLIDDSGELFITQSRNITALVEQKIFIYDNSNIVESYPGVSLPLTFSFAQRAYRGLFSSYFIHMGFSASFINKYHEIFDELIGYIDGHIYYNLTNCYIMLELVPRLLRNKKAWEQLIGIKNGLYLNLSKPPFFSSLSYLFNFMGRLMNHENYMKKFMKEFEYNYRVFNQNIFEELDSNSYLKMVDELTDKFLYKWSPTIFNDAIAMIFYETIGTLIQKFKLGKDSLRNELLCDAEDFDSILPINSLLEICRAIKRSNSLMKHFSRLENKEILQKIMNDKQYSKIKAMFTSHLIQFGDRRFEELKLESPTFIENPISVICLLRSYLNGQIYKSLSRKKEKAIKESAERKIFSALKHKPIKRVVFTWVLKKCKSGIKFRENQRLARAKIFTLGRKIYLNLGEDLFKENKIKDRQDIFYLTMDEVKNYCRNRYNKEDIEKLIHFRKCKIHKAKQRIVPDRIMTQGILDHLAFEQRFQEVLPQKDDNLDDSTKKLRGLGASTGQVTGKARVVFDPHEFLDKKGYILVTRMTDPGWIFLMIQSAGIVVEKGSLLSHTAIIGREFGIPTIVGVTSATKLIPDDSIVQIDGKKGTIQIL